MRLCKRILGVLITLVLLALAMVNTHTIALNLPLYPEYSLEVPVYFLIFASMAAGVIFSGLTGLAVRIRRAQQVTEERRKSRKLEKEVGKLKAETSLVTKP